MIVRVEWKQPGKYDGDLDSLASGRRSDKPTLTQQHMGPETDINYLVRKYGLTGEIPMRRELGEYGEFDADMDFQTLLRNVKAGEAMFNHVPADVRGRFENNAGAFLEWIHEESNYDEAVELGLVPKRVAAVAPVAPAAPGAVVPPVAAPVAP